MIMSPLSSHNFTQMSDPSSFPDVTSTSVFLTADQQNRVTSNSMSSPFGCGTIFHCTQTFFSFTSIVNTGTDGGSREVDLQAPRILNIGTKGLWSASRTGPLAPDEGHRLETVWTFRTGENLLHLPTIAPRFLGRFGHFTD